MVSFPQIAQVIAEIQVATWSNKMLNQGAHKFIRDNLRHLREHLFYTY